MSIKCNAAKGRKYWLDQVDPELKKSYIVRMCPTINFNSRMKIGFFRSLMRIPGPTGKGVSAKRIRGIGMMYFPSETTKTSTTIFRRTAVLYIHGGGRIMGCSSGAMESKMCSKIVQLLNVPVMSASYRLAPSNPFPAGLDDVLNAYKWLAEHMDETATADENLDTSVNILVVGESAGAGLAAELCQRLLDDHRSGELLPPLPVAQLLYYPMMDDRTSTDGHIDSSLPPHLVWNHTSNLYGWSAYLGTNTEPGQTVLPAYAAASRRKDFTGLPPTWIAVGDLDLLCRESREHIQRLRNAGVDTKYEEVKGGFHGMVTMCSDQAKPIACLWSSFQDFGLRYSS